MEDNIKSVEERKEISYLAFESSQARMERINTKLFVVVIILLIALIGSNIGWIVYENQFQDVVVTQEATSDGDSDISVQNVNGDYYGRESQANRQD